MLIPIPDLSHSHILVVGDLMLDRYWRGSAARISPEAPVPVLRVRQAEDRPGGAANVAMNLATLGARVTLLGLVGDDPAGSSLRQLLEQAGVNCQFVTSAGRETCTKLRVLSQNQQLLRLDFEDEADTTEAAALRQRFEAMLGAADAVIFSDYGKGALVDGAALLAMARAADKPVIANPKGHLFERYAQATMLSTNMTEFEAGLGKVRDEGDFLARAVALRERLSLGGLLVTRSERGMSLFRADSPPLHQPTHAREVYDVTGASDTVVAVLGGAMAAGLSVPESMQLANLAAGVVVGKLGTATVSRTELEVAMQFHEPLPRGVVDETQLLALIARARASGERIVMTNGCFDILHVGHVSYLSEARSLGDRLIVAVNDDASVRRLKGADRPLNNLIKRMTVLAGLESVDWVLPFSEDTPERLICSLLPDVLVKGGDYTPDAIAGGRCVREHGGEVLVLQFVDGCSTTSLIETVRKPL